MGEVTLLQRLHHPHIIGYYESFKTENVLSIVMQYAEGGTMDKMISDQKGVFFSEQQVLNYFTQTENVLSIVMQYAEGGTMDKMISDQKGVFFSEQQVLNYFTQVAIGLEYMHSKQILHRDLKTQNILLNKKRTIVKLSDFGISKELSTRSLASTVVGTPNYLSPEICEGRAYNQKSDLWALGCVLYELCELGRAFDGENLPSIVMKITRGKHGPISEHWSAELKRLIESLLDLNENKRPLLKEILTCPLVLPVCMSIHLDLGRLPAAPSRKSRPMGISNSKVLRTQPVRTRSQIGSVE
ncbi:Serine/threonine-protein kinase Nek8 [Toxocara canis]|uniref:non-specific serine/threonine protein kinase n=1 Tax=Toxocara canis TaxID=6265 RepID=A0A0B2VE30_TOXCA|nr:Serine/threonine-protein kinase Nek8 [Toxocara canis]